jgi:hypothetical protein
MHTLLIILLLLLPIVLYWVFKLLFKTEQHRKNTFAVKAALHKMIKSHGLSIPDIFILGNKLIGLDRKTNKIICIDQENNSLQKKLFLLKEIQFCRIVKEVDSLTGCTRKVDLEITFHTGEEPAYFTFYEEATDPVYELPSRIRKANYWKSKIQVQLNGIKPPMLEYVL